MTSQSLRLAIRQQRRSLPYRETAACAEQLALQARKHPAIMRSQRIAAYIANDGEIDPLPLLDYLWSSGKQVYLPVLVQFSRQKLWFARFNRNDMLAPNRFGIPEPVKRDLIKPCALELVLTPLVAFDSCGHRIGMGGGFYDRTFAFLHKRKHWCRPVMIGLAYELQKQTRIEPNKWDVPLHAVATEAQLYTTM